MFRFSLIWDALKEQQLEVGLHITTVKRCKESVPSHFSPLRMKDWVIFQPTDYERRLEGKIALLPKTKSPPLSTCGKEQNEKFRRKCPSFPILDEDERVEILGAGCIFAKIDIPFPFHCAQLSLCRKCPNFPVSGQKREILGCLLHF